MCKEQIFYFFFFEILKLQIVPFNFNKARKLLLRKNPPKKSPLTPFWNSYSKQQQPYLVRKVDKL